MEEEATSQKCILSRDHSPGNGTPILAKDAIHLLTVFPEEVWHSIFTHVDNAHDYFRITGASPFFFPLLDKQRPLVLLSSVIPIWIKRTAHHFSDWEMPWDDEDKDDEDSDQEDFLWPEEYLFEQLANMRLVCRAWKEGVADVLLNLPYRRTNIIYGDTDKWKLNEKHYCERIVDYFTPWKFTEARSYKRFQDHWSPTPWNPFPARRIHLGISRREPQSPLRPIYKACFGFLRNFGTHVWNLQLGVDVVADQVAFYRRFKRMLQLLPNLRILRFSHFSRRDSAIPEYQLRRLVESFMGVKTPNLTLLDQSFMPLPLCKQLLLQPLPELHTLEMRLTNEEEVEMFFDGQLEHLRLTKLCLIMPQPMDTAVVGRIFSGLESQFGETLTELQLWLPENTPFLLEDRLKLPNLKVLQLELGKEFGERDSQRPGMAVALDCLLEMAHTLEQLKLIMDLKTGGMQTEMWQREERQVKFYQHLEKLHESNVWSVFPKLKWVYVWLNRDMFVPEWCCKRGEQGQVRKH